MVKLKHPSKVLFFGLNFLTINTRYIYEHLLAWYVLSLYICKVHNKNRTLTTLKKINYESRN